MAEIGDQISIITGMNFCPLIIGYFCKFMRKVSLDNCNTFGIGVSAPDICPRCSDQDDRKDNEQRFLWYARSEPAVPSCSQ